MVESLAHRVADYRSKNRYQGAVLCHDVSLEEK
jgi:hypothetical protein